MQDAWETGVRITVRMYGGDHEVGWVGRRGRGGEGGGGARGCPCASASGGVEQAHEQRVGMRRASATTGCTRWVRSAGCTMQRKQRFGSLGAPAGPDEVEEPLAWLLAPMLCMLCMLWPLAP